MIRVWGPLAISLVLACAVAGSEADAAEDTAPALVSKSDVKAASDRAANWLIDHQRADGSYGIYLADVGVTAMVVHALADCPRAYREEDGPFISLAVEYLLKNVQADGGVYNADQGLRNYKSSVTLLALNALDQGRKKRRYVPQISALAGFIRGLQCSEDSSPTPYDAEKHWMYGGTGYGSDRRPDISNTQFSLEALHAYGLSEDSEVWKRVSVFLRRCQNLSETNDFLDGTDHKSTEDGGFFYYPGESKAGNIENPDGSRSYSSYGSMTYAGLKSYIFAGLSRDDVRVKKAWQWIRKNYSIERNPGMATEKNPERGWMGLYYYYVVMSRTLELLEAEVVETLDGKKHRWAAELATQLISLQSADGSFVNPVDRWWEGDRALVTAYALRALSSCARSLKE